MGIKALSGVVPGWYTPKQDDLEGLPTKFHLSPLNPEQLDVVLEGASMHEGIIRLTAFGTKQALTMGLLGWENFADNKGEVEFSPVNFKKIPWVTRRDVAGEIVNMSFLSEGEEKNS